MVCIWTATFLVTSITNPIALVFGNVWNVPQYYMTKKHRMQYITLHSESSGRTQYINDSAQIKTSYPGGTTFPLDHAKVVLTAQGEQRGNFLIWANESIIIYDPWGHA